MDMDKIKVAEVLKTISKNATQCILSNLQKCEKYSFNNEDFKGFKVINVEFADGYYDNQFVEFEIEETPEWLYGIWWNGANEYNQLLGCFFAQYKENIDKFKPTHSNIKVDFTLSFNYDTLTLMESEPPCVYDIIENISFIKNEPYLAFCRDCLSWNYNLSYHTREEAERKFKDYKRSKINSRNAKEEFDKKIMNVVMKYFKVYMDEGVCTLDDIGEGWSPRYNIIINKDTKNKKFRLVDPDMEPTIDIFEHMLPMDRSFVKDFVKEFNSVLSDCSIKALQEDMYWDSPVSSYIEVVDGKTFKDIKRKNRTR